MSADLLSCPFCGSSAISTGENNNLTRWSAYCLDCDAEVVDSKTEEEAIAAWNRRAPVQAQGVALTVPTWKERLFSDEPNAERFSECTQQGLSSGHMQAEIADLRALLAQAQPVSAEDKLYADRWRYIEDHASAIGGGNGFTIKCVIPFDCEDMGCGVDQAIAALTKEAK